MAGGANLSNAQVLSDLKNALARFGTSVQQSLDHVEGKMRAFEENLRRKRVEAQRALDKAEDNVLYAQRAVEECEAQGDEEYGPDCSCEYDELDYARGSLRRAEARLHEVRRLVAKVERQILDYRSMAARLKKLAIQRTGQAMNILQMKISSVEQYSAVTPNAGEMAGLENSSGRNGAENVAAGGGISTFTGALSTSQSLSGASLSVGTSGKWQEMGVVNIELSNLGTVEGISGPSDFSKVSMKVMEAGLNRLQTMKKSIAAGPGNCKEFWVEKDRKLGLSYPEGYQRIYEAFYGHDAIRVTKSGSDYSVDNGRHRIWLAKRMGIQSLPIKLVEAKNG